MAHIPIEKKETNVWPWVILGLLLVGAIVAWIALSDDDDDFETAEIVETEVYVGEEAAEEFAEAKRPIVAEPIVEEPIVDEPVFDEPIVAVVEDPIGEQPMEQQEQADNLMGPVTTTEVLNTIDPGALDGKELRIDEMKVTRVVGDKTFYVSEEATGEREYFVVLDEVPTPGTPTEGRYDVTAGQTLTIHGTVEQTEDIDASQFQLTEQEARAMRGDKLFLRAQKLDVRS